MHMESMRVYPGYVTVGGMDAPRLQRARRLALIDDYRIPWQALAQMGQRDLQQHPQIRQVYSAAAGWSHFWLDHADPSYRAAWLGALDQLYRGQPWRDSETVEARLQVPAAELDRQYVAFLEVTDDQLRALSLNGAARELSLAGTPITDAGLTQLARLSVLEVLDLERTTVGDVGLREVAQLPHLRELTLTGTRVTDETLDRLTGLPSLEVVTCDSTPTSAAARERLQRHLDRRRGGGGKAF
jgi:hypothetical protein